MKTEIVTKNGVKYFAADGKIIDTLAFKSFRPTANNVGDFYKAGVRIFHVFCSGLMSALKVPYSQFGETWFGDKEYDFQNLDKQIEFFKENAPDAYVFINVHLDVRQWWLDQNPGRPNSFTHLSQIAGDEKWKKDTADYLKALIEHVEAKYDEFVLGYFLLGGTTTEWFSDYDYEETHPIKLEAFRKYMNDENITIPTKEELEKPVNQIFLDPIKDKTVIEYRKFHNNLIADLVLYYAHAAQEVLNHKKLVGLFFGYIMELGGPRLWNAGHIEADKVYRSGDVDLIATPSSYQFRDYDDATAYMLLCDTIELNGMTYFSSFDHRTFTVPTLADNKRRICGDNDAMKGVAQLATMRKDLLDTREKTIHGIRREFMQRVARRTGMWWFDMLEGWFYDDGLMEEIGQIAKISETFIEKDYESSSEVAVIVSAESLYYVNKCSRLNTELICNQRDALARMGAPYDIYSLNDIDRIDINKYKAVIFIDAYCLTDEQRDYINNVVKKDGRTLLFISGCDCISDDGFSKEKMEKMCGFKLGTLEIDEPTIESCNTVYGYARAKTPTWYIDEAVTVLGCYELSRKCGIAKKGFGEYNVYFSGLGNISAGVLRHILKDAGVFIYAENDTPVYVNSGFVGVYNTKSEFTEVKVPFDGEFTEIFSGERYKSHNGSVTLPTGKCPAQMLVIEEN
jgi:hypothetical protein